MLDRLSVVVRAASFVVGRSPFAGAPQLRLNPRALACGEHLGFTP
jgi:hypothetical protein